MNLRPYVRLLPYSFFSCNSFLPCTVSSRFPCIVLFVLLFLTFTFHLFIKACPTNCHCHFLSSILSPLTLQALLPQGLSLWEMRAEKEGWGWRLAKTTTRRVAVREGSRKVESGDIKTNCTSNVPWLLMDNKRHGFPLISLLIILISTVYEDMPFNNLQIFVYSFRNVFQLIKTMARKASLLPFHSKSFKITCNLITVNSKTLQLNLRSIEIKISA